MFICCILICILTLTLCSNREAILGIPNNTTSKAVILDLLLQPHINLAAPQILNITHHPNNTPIRVHLQHNHMVVNKQRMVPRLTNNQHMVHHQINSNRFMVRILASSNLYTVASRLLTVDQLLSNHHMVESSIKTPMVVARLLKRRILHQGAILKVVLHTANSLRTLATCSSLNTSIFRGCIMRSTQVGCMVMLAVHRMSQRILIRIMVSIMVSIRDGKPFWSARVRMRQMRF